ncbi:MAG: molybdopterin biosynthesis protein [Clostridiales bacterium]|nr:molybdopterin biosynthesis protein [Clostridiales bacterium]
MGFEYLTNIPLDKAREEYISLLEKNGMAPSGETIPVQHSAGRVTAGAVYARLSSPHYNASAMDGIALDAGLTYGASDTTPVVLRKDQFIPVDTGDPLPDGCDTVVMIEDVIEEENGVRLYHAAAPWQHVRQIGEDICAGDMLLPSYSEISPSAIGALIAGGIHELSVIKKPVVGIIPTGDEIVPPTPEPVQGEIPEFNSAIFSAMLRQWGAEPVVLPIVKDDQDQIKDALTAALERCDVVLLNAGSSAGREDYSKQVIKQVGDVLYHGIAIKPGKPAILGYKGGKPILGIPGYPVSGIIVIEELLRPIIEILTKRRPRDIQYEEAVLSKAVVSSLKYEEFIRVRLGYVRDRLIASPLSRGSGVVSSFMKADGILDIPQGLEGYESGAAVKVRLLRPAAELKSNLVAIGSHDPLLDEVSDIMRTFWSDTSMSSAHVGSMGGIMSVRRGEAHVAGTHLLDEKTGGYNISFIQKYFPNGGVRLVECVRRSQGLMVAKGNPKKLQSIADLTTTGLRYVNRQKGSGTRVLCDYLCKKENIDTSAVYGYEREEYTHTSVAALIAGNSADAGLGIYSAAKLYDLDFIPICDEQYDLLVPDYAWDTLLLNRLLEVLKSDAFRTRLLRLGGYAIDNPGTVRERF